MQITDMLDIQIGLAYTKAKELIKSLDQNEGLYIINKDREVRVLFYYKEDTYFISDAFPLEIDFIEYSDQNEIVEICEEISKKFEGTDLLRESTLVKNKKEIILKYLINSLIITVNRSECRIIEVDSLEVYNDMVLVTPKGVFKIFKENNTIFYDRFNISQADYSDLEDIIKNVYEEYDIFPHDYRYKIYNMLDIKDIVPSNGISPIIAISMVSSEELVSLGYVSLKNDIKYKDRDIITMVNDILEVTDESEDIQYDLNIIVDDLYYNYELDCKTLN